MSRNILYISPNSTIAHNQLFIGLSKSKILGESEATKLQCNELGVHLDIDLPNLLNSACNKLAPYRESKALGVINEMLAPHSSYEPALRNFIRFSPWLLGEIDSEVKQHNPFLHQILLVRVVNLLLHAFAEHPATLGGFVQTHCLLIRARFLLLATLYEMAATNPDHDEKLHEFLPTSEPDLLDAWQSWVDTLINNRQQVQRALAGSKRALEDEGICTLFSDPSGTQFWCFLQQGVNREQPTVSTEIQQTIEDLVTVWFAPRYDFGRVLQVLHYTTESPRWWLRLLPCLSILSSFGILIALLVLPLLGSATIDLSAWIGCLAPNPVELAGFLSQMIWLILVIGLIVTTLLQVNTFGIWSFRLLMPRITLAIVVGYLALISSSEMLRTALLLYERHHILMWFCIGGVLSFSILNLYAEVRRHLDSVEQGTTMAWRRVLRIVLLALSRSLVIGWLILVPLGALLLGELPRTLLQTGPLTAWPGLFGWSIYPQLLLVYAPLAFLIGTIAQTIWERDSLTKPL